MIDPVQYIIFCHDALIPIGRTEMRGLKKLTDKDGWLDEDRYLRIMKRLGIPITQHQLDIMENMPQRGTPTDESMAMLRKCADMAKEFYKINRIKAARG